MSCERFTTSPLSFNCPYNACEETGKEGLSCINPTSVSETNGQPEDTMNKTSEVNQNGLYRERPHRIYERGQSLVEYAKLLVLISILVIGALVVLGVGLNDTYCQIAGELDTSVEGERCMSDVLPGPSIIKAEYDAK